MNPDEFPSQNPMEEPMTAASESDNTNYQPQPLPEVLVGAIAPPPPERDPWAEARPAESPTASPETPAEPQPTDADLSEAAGSVEPGSVEPLLAELISETDPEWENAEGMPMVAVGSGGGGNEPPSDLDQDADTAFSDLPEDELGDRVSALRREEARLRQQVAQLQTEFAQTQSAVGRLVSEGLSELEQRKQALQIAIEQLERRQERIRAEMRTTFAGTSQDLAIRIQGFKEYLVGSLQDLVAAADDLKLAPPPAAEAPRRVAREPEVPDEAPKPQFAEQNFQDAARMIRKQLDQYRNTPDYYGPPWQLRRTFEPIHAERVAEWFFEQGGRGAIRTMGSRLQNILVASAAISVLNRMYGDRIRTLVLSDSPERLGEWRRGLQDCLGIGRMDFGTNQGVTLFDAPEPVAQRADRLVKQKYLPLIIIDESEGLVDLSLLQFPLWLAFAIDPMKPPMPY